MMVLVSTEFPSKPPPVSPEATQLEEADHSMSCPAFPAQSARAHNRPRPKPSHHLE